MRRHIPWAAALVAATAVTVPTTSADAQANECRMHAPLQSTRLLRRTSLALLGRVPTVDEYVQVRDIEPESDAFDAVTIEQGKVFEVDMFSLPLGDIVAPQKLTITIDK